MAVFLTWFMLSAAWAQSPALPAGQRLSDTEAISLRELLKTQPPEAVNAALVDDHYRRLDAAALRLGDMRERERVLREWTEKSTSMDARWTYASFLLNSEKIREGFVQFEALIKELKIPQEQVRARSRLAISYIDQSDLKRAEQLLQESEQIIGQSFPRNRTGAGGYWLTRAEMEFNNIKGRLLLRQGKFNDALEASRLAHTKGLQLQSLEPWVDARQRLFSRSAHAWVLTETAMIYNAMGRLYDADDTLRQAYALYRQYGLTEDLMIEFYRRVADLRFFETQYDEARRIYNTVAEIQKRQGIPPNSAQMLFTRKGIHATLAAQKKWPELLASFDEVDEYAKGNPRLQNIVRQVDLRALTYLNSQRVSQAQQLMRGTLAWHTSNYGADHYYTALMRGIYAMSLAASSAPAERAQARGEFERAVNVMTTPNTLTSDYQESQFRIDIKHMILQSYLNLLTEGAATHANDAALAFTVANQLIASSVQQAIAEAAARAGIKQPELAEAVRLDQDAKNELISLYAYITAQGSEVGDRRNPEIVKSMRERIRELETTRADLKARIQKDFPDYFQLLQPRSPTPSDIAKNLKGQELFVSIITLQDKTLSFAVAADGRVTLHRSDTGQGQMGAWVQQVRKHLDVAGLGAQAPAFDVKTAHEIYRQVLQPLEPQMAGKDHLIIATSGSLGQIPFAVLPQKPAQVQTPWLIQKYAISHIPSASAWVSLKRLTATPAGTQPLLAWGDPLFDGRQVAKTASTSQAVRSVLSQRLPKVLDLDKQRIDPVTYSEIPPLPETRDEVLALAKILGANPNTDVVLGERATRESVLAQNQSGALYQKQVIAFATHGLLPGDLPHLDQPALAMAVNPNSKENPLLTLEDVLGLKLNADWVILSACNTAGADGREEEALSGLARGFFYAGGRSLLVTHWSVESESAMLLTRHTFEAYRANPQMTRAAALRAGALHVMAQKGYAHPAFWAPYALVGEGGR